MANEMKDIPREFWEDDQWAIDHFSDLVRQYPDKWVAIVDKKVVAATDKGIVATRELARKKTGRKHIPVHFCETGGNIYGC